MPLDSARILAHAMLNRVFNPPKDPNETGNSTNLTVPLWNTNWQSSSSSIIDGSLLSQSPRALSIYALGPSKKYDFSRAQKLLQTELNRRCQKVSKSTHYDPKFSADLVRDLSQQLRRVMNSDYLHCLRYKFVLLISVVQVAPDRQTHQSINFVSRCLWNGETDGSVTVQTKLGLDMMVVATLFAIYTD